MTLDQTTVWHYGGALSFGPDGMLYYPRGDGGGEGDPENDAQNPMNRYGKVLRIDTSTFPAPPPGNMPNADPFVWDMGLRNPWRWSFDRCTGDLYIGDVGQGEIEEVSVQLASQQHLDFGWNEYEGTSCFNPPCDPTGKHMPAAEHQHTDGWCAVVGGYAYRGSLLSGHRGRYFYGDICSRRIVSFRIDASGNAVEPMDHTDDLDSQNVLGDYMFGSFGEDLEGELYVLDMTGTIFRIEPD
jgi:glucose/arabinose dehydrogenase